MTPLSFLALVTYCGVFVQSVSSRSEETTSSYSCCPSPQIRFDQRCEHLWVIDDTTIALSKGEMKNFIAPIKELKDDRVMLDQCVDVNVTITCTNNNGEAEEQRIRYRGDPCPTPISGNMAPGNQGCVPLLLLAALVLVLIR